MEKKFTAAERLAWFYMMRADRIARLERINKRIVALELEVAGHLEPVTQDWSQRVTAELAVLRTRQVK